MTSLYPIIGIAAAVLVSVIILVVLYRIKKKRQSLPSNDRVSYHRNRQALSGIYEDIPDNLPYNTLQRRAPTTDRTYALLQGFRRVRCYTFA